jgi:NADP-dependent 3-hydroxy acid dehydrogenase YdfG
MNQFHSKSLFIRAGTKGIGIGCAKHIVKDGAQMFNASSNAELLSAVADDLVADGTAPRYRF